MWIRRKRGRKNNVKTIQLLRNLKKQHRKNKNPTNHYKICLFNPCDQHKILNYSNQHKSTSDQHKSCHRNLYLPHYNNLTPLSISPPSISPFHSQTLLQISFGVQRYVMPFGRTFMIALPSVLISRIRSFAAILPASPPRCGWSG